jgi:hypothetical protein
MGRPRDFRAYSCNFEANPRSYGKAGLTARGTVCYALGQRETWTAPTFESFCAEWDSKNGYKIGVLPRPGQAIRVTYGARGGGEIELRPDPAETAELEGLLGPGWIGLVPATKAARALTLEPPNLATFPITVSVDPAQGRIQLIPVVVRYREGTFASGFMPSMWTLLPLR